LILLSLIWLAFILTIKPFKENRQMIIELFNEFNMLLMNYLILIFSDFIAADKTKSLAGKAF
jgi:uncharacterized protein YhhL (DUF1145 family)